ncbi:MAG TPA: hypothetical protein VF111_07130, partial [Thermoanaerobaculia bacterium]
MTRIGVKFREIRNLYVLIVFAPGSRKKVLERRVARRPWPPFESGATLRIDGRSMVVEALAERIERHGDAIEHVTELFTRGRRRRIEPPPANVVPMPTGERSTIEQFLLLHALVRRFDGNVDAWLEDLGAHGIREGDLRFVRSMRSRLRRDPRLLEAIRRMVDAT